MDCLQLFAKLRKEAKSHRVVRFMDFPNDIKSALRCMLLANLKFVQDARYQNAVTCILSDTIDLVLFNQDHLVMYNHHKKNVSIDSMFGVICYQAFLAGKFNSPETDALLPVVQRRFGYEFEFTKIQGIVYISDGITYLSFYDLADFDETMFPINICSAVFLDRSHFVKLSGDDNNVDL